jgi:hypothetical protein
LKLQQGVLAAIDRRRPGDEIAGVEQSLDAEETRKIGGGRMHTVFMSAWVRPDPITLGGADAQTGHRCDLHPAVRWPRRAQTVRHGR